MSRYVQAEVDDAIAQVERGVFTPHAQIVLAAEVTALRETVNKIAFLEMDNHARIAALRARLGDVHEAAAAYVNDPKPETERVLRTVLATPLTEPVP